MPDKRFPFSNFQPCVVYLDGQACSTVEHAYQAAKTVDPSERKTVIDARTPAGARRLGRGVHQRPGWDELKGGIMLGLLRQKFVLGTEYADNLIAFDGPIVEWNTWHDTYWGRCTCDRHNGQGANVLGILLTALRAELLREAEREAVTKKSGGI